MSERRHQYPGGRPVRREPTPKPLPIERIASSEPLTLGLRRGRERIEAIGFRMHELPVEPCE
jgi:hypothetical protein